MRGIRLNLRKQATMVSWTLKKPRGSFKIRIPLFSLPAVSDLRPCVKPGDLVMIGQKVADSHDPQGVPVFSGVCGRVVGQVSVEHPVLGNISALEIQTEGREDMVPGLSQERPHWDHLDSRELLALFRENGLVEMRGLPLALHATVMRNAATPPSLLIVNACESEPYGTSAHALTMTHAMEVLRGAEILRKACGAKKLIVAVQEDILEVVELLRSKIYFLKWKHAEVCALPAMYPQEMFYPLVRAVTGTNLLPKRQDALHRGLAADPFLEADLAASAGIAVHDISTAFAAYEAVALRKPLYERAVTVTGECLIEPKNLRVPLGLAAEDALKACRGVMREPGALVLNGPMRGSRVSDPRMPLAAGDPILAAMPKEATESGPETSCTHCSRCVEVCPAEISPVFIALAAQDKEFKEAMKWGAGLCFHCGNCTYICPSRIPLDRLIHQAQESLFPAACAPEGAVLAQKE